MSPHRPRRSRRSKWGRSDGTDRIVPGQTGARFRRRPRPRASGLVGNQLRLLRGGSPRSSAGCSRFFFMTLEAQFRWGVPLGILGVASASFGVLDFLGSFDDPEERVAARHRSATSASRSLGVIGVARRHLVFHRASRRTGKLPIAGAAVLITASFVGLVVAVFQRGVALGPWAVDEAGKRARIWKTPRLLGRAHRDVALPARCMGSYSLSDPWETHYGEVAREMLSRNDWISTWWAQDGWFWSKPVLDFWMQALAMGIFGVQLPPRSRC